MQHITVQATILWGSAVLVLLAAILGTVAGYFIWQVRQARMQWRRSDAMARRRNAIQEHLRAMEAEQQAIRHDWWAAQESPETNYYDDKMP